MVKNISIITRIKCFFDLDGDLLESGSVDLENISYDLSIEDLEKINKLLKKKYLVDEKAYVELEVLGKGAFGRVLRVFDKSQNKYLALKKLNADHLRARLFFKQISWG